MHGDNSVKLDFMFLKSVHASDILHTLFNVPGVVTVLSWP
jgi:hypothetical protein